MDRKRIIAISIFVFVFTIAIIFSIAYYNGKYSVRFETGTTDIFMTKYVSKNSRVSEPSIPTKNGYVFEEWQLNGEKYDFNTKINSNIVLTAKWVKEEYVTVSYDTDSEKTIESIKIIKGKSIDELPIPYKDNYTFEGWYIGDKKYNMDEIYDDVVLVAHYTPNKLNDSYKVGDKVKIIGNYASSSNSDYPYHSKAIGWKRKIMYVLVNSEYPYAVGNKNGITGFFQASSIEKIN